ncbi:MAG: DNA adenine methylase [Gallionella sp.]|nr:DNA adenine methylase [Gallionella sp.]
MGTKRDIAPMVADIICSAKPGITLDAFSGMCAIGQAVGERRNVWNNDIQVFPSEVANALFTSEVSPPSQEEIISAVAPFYYANKEELTRRFSKRLNLEASAISDNTFQAMKEYLENAAHVGNYSYLNEIRCHLNNQPKLFPYCLFTITFSDGYFGFAQSVEIDSIRYAIAQCEERGLLLPDESRWLLISLSHAVVKVATTTGHFAQYLNINENNARGYITKRQRSVWDAWLECTLNLKPAGSKNWRKKNRVFNMDSLSLLQRLSMTKQKPSVVYADPPYTKDQYSRYYHIWETLVKYDYPAA